MVKHFKTDKNNSRSRNKTNWSLKSLKKIKLEKNQALESTGGLLPKKMRTNEIKNEINETEKPEEKINQK